MNAGRRAKGKASCYLVLGLGLVCFAVVFANHALAKESVTPHKRDIFMWLQRRDDFVLRVDLSNPPVSQEPIDILFLFDTTASMTNVIGACRTGAGEIMMALRSISSNTAFAVASFGDYPPYGYPWRLDQDFTSDTGLIQRALNSLQLVNGGDIPEAYSRALYESQFLLWRRDARRFIILFGDAPAHDPEFYGKNFGIDPGRDGVPGTADDLRLRDVVDQLVAQKITIIPVYDSTRWLPNKIFFGDAVKGFSFMAQQTRGIIKPVGSASEIPKAIAAGVREAYRPRPMVVIPETFRSWVSLSELKRKSSNNRNFAFEVILHPPSGTVSGVHRFPLTAVYGEGVGGTEIGRTDVTIRLGFFYYPWRRLLFPLYGFFVLALLLPWTKREIIRYEHNGQYWAVFWRFLVAVLLFQFVYHLWIQEPDTGHEETIEVMSSRESQNARDS